jgi:hypothetical protein
MTGDLGPVVAGLLDRKLDFQPIGVHDHDDNEHDHCPVRIFREWHNVDSGFDGAVVTTSEELLTVRRASSGACTTAASLW